MSHSTLLLKITELALYQLFMTLKIKSKVQTNGYGRQRYEKKEYFKIPTFGMYSELWHNNLILMFLIVLFLYIVSQKPRPTDSP